MYTYLIDRIAAALAAAFPQTHIYSDSVRQNFRKPAIFIGLEEVVYGQELKDRLYADFSMKISYYEARAEDERESSFFADLEATAFNLLNALIFIGTEGQGLYGKGMRQKINDLGVLEFDVTYRLTGILSASSEDLVPMNKIEISEGVR